MNAGTDRRGRVVLVDPTDHLVGTVGDALGAEGFSVAPAETAAACIRHLEDETVDGIVSTYDIPDLDGLQLLRSVRIGHPDLPFVLAPRTGSEAIAAESFAAGANGYVPSGADPDAVVSRFERSLRETRSRVSSAHHDKYRHLIEISPAPVNVFDDAGEIIWGNDAVLELLGLEHRADLLGRSIFEFVHPDDHDRARAELAAVTEQKSSTGPTSMRLAPPDGEVRYIRVSTAIGRFLGADIGQAIVVDVTAQKEREHQLDVLDTWLRHNIRNGVALIEGVAADIEREESGETAARARRIQDRATTLLEQADRERQLIEFLTSAPSTAPLEGRDVLAEAIALLREDCPTGEITVSRCEDLTIRASPKLPEAIRELLENAITHAEQDEPTVDVQVYAKSPARGVIRIADTGPGIPAMEQDYLDIEGEVDHLHHGSGLGLVFTSWVVRRSGGSLEFEQNEPRGSVITLEFERAPDEPTTPG